MTRDTEAAFEFAGDSSRRTFLEKGAFASLAVALSTVNSDAVSAQTTGDADHDGLMFSYQLPSDERFRVVSDPIDWGPPSGRGTGEQQTETGEAEGRQQEGNQSTANLEEETGIPDAEEEEEGAEGRQQEGNRSTAYQGAETGLPDEGEEAEEGEGGQQQEGNRSTAHEGTATDLPDGSNRYRTHVISFPSPHFAFLFVPEGSNVQRDRRYDLEESTRAYDEELRLVAVNFDAADHDG